MPAGSKTARVRSLTHFPPTAASRWRWPRSPSAILCALVTEDFFGVKRGRDTDATFSARPENGTRELGELIPARPPGGVWDAPCAESPVFAAGSGAWRAAVGNFPPMAAGPTAALRWNRHCGPQISVSSGQARDGRRGNDGSRHHRDTVDSNAGRAVAKCEVARDRGLDVNDPVIRHDGDHGAPATYPTPHSKVSRATVAAGVRPTGTRQHACRTSSVRGRRCRTRITQ